MNRNLNLLSLSETLAQRCKSRATHYRDINSGLYPPPVRVGKRAVAWPSHEVDQIIAGQIAGLSDEQIRVLVKRIVEARKSAGMETADGD